MEVTRNKRRFFSTVDVLLERKRENLFPFNTEQAYVPQLLIPQEIRQDTILLGTFYLIICTWMRGGLESHTAFKLFIKGCAKHPELLDPKWIAEVPYERLYTIISNIIGWDAKAATGFIKENMTLFHRNWGGDLLKLLRGVSSYEEACRRLRNKNGRSGKNKLPSLDPVETGFIGFQFKMVSMLLYFCDWEGWLKPRFLYPSPADFHHYRIFLANEAILVKNGKGPIRYTEEISRPIRDLLMAYLVERQADPVEVADALWLYSLLMCGESPFTITREQPTERPALLAKSGVEETWDLSQWAQRRKKRIQRTCGACILADTCKYAIPSKPYYRKGILQLNPRPKVGFLPVRQVPVTVCKKPTEEQHELFTPDE